MKSYSSNRTERLLTNPFKLGEKFQPTEHDIQSAIVSWSKQMSAKIPVLQLLFAIPNGGKRKKFTGYLMKREGVKRGVPDLFLPVPMMGIGREFMARHGLFLEVKRGTKGVVSPDQEDWHRMLRAQDYDVRIVRSLEEGIDAILNYLNFPMTTPPTPRPPETKQPTDAEMFERRVKNRAQKFRIPRKEAEEQIRELDARRAAKK